MKKLTIKSALRSKTVWFGILYVLGAVAGLFGFADYQPTPEVNNIVEVVTGVLIIGLRFLTKEPVRLGL
jgi:hypothetical protein